MYLRPHQVINRSSTRAVAIDDPLVKKAVSFLKRNLDSQSPLQDLVQSLGCSHGHLCRRFRKVIGTSPQKYHDQLRLSLAIDLLHKPDLSMSDIATRTGFASRMAFTYAFRRRYGCSPSEWRHGSSKKDE